MSGEQHSEYNSRPGPPSQDEEMREAAFTLITSLETHIETLAHGSPEARRIARELQIVLDEIRHALRN